MKNSRKSFLSSVIVFMLCVAMFIGTTFAWFTDNVTSSGNIIKSGNLDVEMYWTDDLNSGTWYNVEDDEHNTIFDYDNWEPGYTEVRYIKIVNAGKLAFNYNLALTPQGKVGKLAEVINVFYANDGIQLNSRDDLSQLNSIGLLSNVMNGRATANGTLLANGQSSPLHKSGETIVTLAMNMITTAGNEYQNESIGDGFTITALASQCPYEEDSFGRNYDSNAEYPAIIMPGNVSVPIDTVNGKVSAGGVTLAGDGFVATVPEGVDVKDGAERLTLTVTPLEYTTTDITTVNQEILIPVDVHMEGVAEDNTTPIIINLGAIMPKYLNMGNYQLIHVEDGVNNFMTYVGENGELTAHNQFKYDPLTGEVIVAMATFSEVALLADTENAWNGTVATEFSGGTGTEADPYIIANADQLAYMGDRVSYENAAYGSAYYKLIADVNIGGKDNSTNIWYPIGYNKVGGEIATVNDGLDEIYFEPISYSQPGDKDGDVVMNMADNSWYTYGGSFKGVFDGNGHTITGIYQNTWAMKGNYDGHYYNAAMGLFGYVNGGTVKNLSIDNFYSEGEFAPTGCVTAYAAGGTFENITITNSHPQTYNTGVAGIVGWDNGNGNNYTFNNITVDDSNTMSALWGSWDVAASGILGSLKNDSEATFNNCHVAATIDVYNDVCGNYQYYWYRYSGAFIGTVYRRLNGNGALDLEYGVEATNCTVDFGDRHEYYYCEFEKNTQASYTEDYQFSRVPHSELNMDENPVICTHTHTANEDKQAVYLPYKQLFGGYGWGVAGMDLDSYVDENGNRIIDISDVTKSEDKFEASDSLQSEYMQDTTVTIGELFKAKATTNEKNQIKKNNVKVFVSPKGAGSTAGGTYIANTDDWTQGTLTFSGLGDATISITDYYFCTTTTINVTIVERQEAEKFDVELPNTDTYLYRAGNANAVALSSLFEAKDGAEIGNVTVSVTSASGNASGTYTANASDWTKGTIKFEGTGVVSISIKDDDKYCLATTLSLEVVDAVNATSATSATKNNVVLLNNVALHTIEVSGGYTLYGNGFKMEAISDVMYNAMNAGFVVLKNGTLDNVQIICPNFSHAVVYNSNITESANKHAASSDASSDAYGNVRSAVMADGNSKIVNSYVHGGRAAIFLRSGNLVVDNSTISGGAAANIHTMSAQSLTLRNATLIQKPFQATVHDTSKTLMGFSGLFECDENGDSTPLILEGTLIQEAWINESFKEYAPSAASSIIDAALKKTDFIHQIDGEDSLNLGFTYIPQNSDGSTNANVTDNRTDKSTVPYESVDVGTSLASAKVYSYKNTNGTSNNFMGNNAYVATTQGVTPPAITFTDTNDSRVFETKFDTSDNRWESTLTVNLDDGDYTFSFAKLLAQKHGSNLSYTVKTENGTSVDTSKAISLTTSGVTTYVLTVEDGATNHTCYFVLTATKTSIPEPEVADTTGGTPLLVVKSKNSDWSCAIPALEGIKIKYWTSVNNSVELDLATLTPTSTGKQNGTNNYWEYSNGYTLKVTCGYIHDTKQVYGMPVVVNNDGNKMYFTISSTNGYVSTSTTGRTVTITYEFTDPNGKTLTFSKTWQFNYADYNTQYSYSDFVNGTLKEASSSGCVTPDTLVTLADGTQKQIQDVTYQDQLLVWDFFNGEYTVMPSSIVMNHGYGNYRVVTLNFADGTTVNTINGHGFYDAEEDKFIILDETNVEDYIGHDFVKQAGINKTTTKLVSYSVAEQYTESWSILTVEHYNCVLEGMLTLTPAEVEGSPEYLMPFEMGEGMKYDVDSMKSDIEKYGLYTYEDFADRITYEQFAALNLQYFKIAVERGIITYDDILFLLDLHM